MGKDKPPAGEEPEYLFLDATNNAFSLNSYTANEVRKLFEMLNVKKTNGLNSLPSKAAQNGAAILAPSLAIMFI